MSISSIPAKLRAEGGSMNSLGNYDDDRETGSVWFRWGQRELEDLRSPSLWRAALAEMVGCALLCMFTIGMGLKKEGEEGPSLFQVAVGSGFFLAVLITALCNVSGAHVNPAISVGFLVSKQITLVRFIIYTIVQTVGAVAGSGLLKVIVPKDYIGGLGYLQPGEGVTWCQALSMEIIITFLLLFVTIAMVDEGREDIAGSVPLMVGLTVAVNVLWAGAISGGCMNPIRNTGPAVVTWNFKNIWIYWAGPMIGGILGTLTYDWLFSTDPIGSKSFRCRRNQTKEPKRSEHLGNGLNQALLQKDLEKAPESDV